MRKIKLYIATSLDGKIAKPDGSVEWLESIPNPDGSHYGYDEFYASIDTTIMGYSTYHQVIRWDIEFPYSGKKNYVVTRKQGLSNTEHVDFISSDHITFIQQLKQTEGKDIWLVGGAQLNAMLMEAHLIDEILVFVMPVLLTEGIDMVSPLSKETALTLIKSKTYSNGVVALHYATD